MSHPPPPLAIAGQGALFARFFTSMGAFVALLEEHRAPSTVAYFVGLATGTSRWLDPLTRAWVEGQPLLRGVLFHRVIDDFMVQTGDPLTRSPETSNRWGTGGPGFEFADEFHPELRHDGPGVLSMANAGPHTNGSQFFVTVTATPHLDRRHAVFGRVVAGLQVVRAIAAAPTNRYDRPHDDIVLERVEIFRSPHAPDA